MGTSWRSIRAHVVGKRRAVKTDELDWVGIVAGRDGSEVFVVLKASDIGGRTHRVVAAGVAEATAVAPEKALAYNAMFERGALAVEAGACVLREVRPVDALCLEDVDDAIDHFAAEASRMRDLI